jgi:hypothetical protein
MTRIERAARACIEDIEKFLRTCPRTTLEGLIQVFGQELVTELIGLGWVELGAHQVAMITGRGRLIVQDIRAARQAGDLHAIGNAKANAAERTWENADLESLLLSGERGDA